MTWLWLHEFSKKWIWRWCLVQVRAAMKRLNRFVHSLAARATTFPNK